ncbi:hypothetical protein C2869_05970 [Saccharobesus litoralis]|uniref:Uncharacterized protein n=1 Tax=Saccharobesus litoralis TaxID=2172099 RepID=A0A2S0VP96_9ALTE|nr:hypothetical protein [Saccharobesus litoralis]AWB66012.1 hypothetical protein C2869_05970 [Saccharobesus litoralis]
MNKIIIRIVACFFAIASTYLLVSFSDGVGEESFIKLVTFIIWGVLSQLGLFLSTYPITKPKYKWLIALMMFPFFMLLLSSTILDSSFIHRLTGNSVQIMSSVAYIVGLGIYIFSYYKMVNGNITKQL